MTKTAVVWNSGSGKAEQIEQLRRTMPPTETCWLKLSDKIDLRRRLETAIDAGCQSVIAAGGDGTVNALVNVLMQFDQSRRPCFGIIPLGTANDFAGTLGIPEDPVHATELIRNTSPIAQDVVRVQGSNVDRYFANVAAGGNCVRVSETLTDDVKSRWGAFSYIRGAVAVLPDMQTYRISANCDDEEIAELDSWAVLVANGKTNAGRIEVAPQAATDDGLIDIIIIRDGTVGDMVEIVANNLLGSFLESEQIIFRQCKSFELYSQPNMRFTLDGEVFDEEPVRFEAVAGAIRMHVGTP